MGPFPISSAWLWPTVWWSVAALCLTQRDKTVRPVSSAKWWHIALLQTEAGSSVTETKVWVIERVFENTRQRVPCSACFYREGSQSKLLWIERSWWKGFWSRAHHEGREVQRGKRRESSAQIQPSAGSSCWGRICSPDCTFAKMGNQKGRTALSLLVLSVALWSQGPPNGDISQLLLLH